MTTIQEEKLGDYPELADLMAEWAATGHMTLTVVPLERAHVGEYVRTMSAMEEQADGPAADDQTRLVHASCQRELQARQRREPEHQLQPATPSRLA